MNINSRNENSFLELSYVNSTFVQNKVRVIDSWLVGQVRLLWVLGVSCSCFSFVCWCVCEEMVRWETR